MSPSKVVKSSYVLRLRLRLQLHLVLSIKFVIDLVLSHLSHLDKERLYDEWLEVEGTGHLRLVSYFFLHQSFCRRCIFDRIQILSRRIPFS